jgi:succinate-semialdehyde dehydrogenase / glutarate-semialdehyde dehydrogenase
MSYQTINPATEEVLKTFKEATDRELEAAIARADWAYANEWRKTSLDERKKIVKKAASLMRSRREELAGLVTLEMGKLLREARAEVDLSADILDYYADRAETFLAPKTLNVAEGQAWVEAAPLGVIFCVEPWNFPYYQLVRVAGPNLMVGNTVIVKHAPNVPQCALAFEKVFLDAGAAPGVYTNVFLSNAQAATAIADTRIQGVALTGSERAGSAVAAEAGKALKKSTMELGGSDAFIVLEDADLDAAVQWAIWARMNNTGESCVAGKRFILHEQIADVFLNRFREELQKLVPGNPADDSTTLGPLCTAGALDHALDQISTAVQGGAKILLGGHRIGRAGYYLEPTILTHVDRKNPVFFEEIFAPVAMIFRVKNEEEAIQLANDSPFGLGGTVMTRDVERGKRIARRIESGMVFINSATWTAPELPFGGVKNSGYGRELAEVGIGEFLNRKLIRVTSPQSTFLPAQRTILG